MPERSGFATTTLGPVFWGERLGATLAARRLARTPARAIASLEAGDAALVRGVVSAREPTLAAPLSGLPSVFGRVLSCREPPPGRRRDARGVLQPAPPPVVVRADVTWGGRFALEDESGTAWIEIDGSDPFELFVLVRRGGAWNRGETHERLARFVEETGHVDLHVDREDEGTVLAEWAIVEGQTLAVLGRVVGQHSAPSSDGYRASRLVPHLGARGDKPIVLVG
jgi:hypothetical protein